MGNINKLVEEILNNPDKSSPGIYKVPLKEKKKEKRINPKTNRMKTFRNLRYMETTIPPAERSMKNIPKYSTGESKVRFQDWLCIESRKLTSDSNSYSYGWSSNGKCYGWSHRAMHGFKIGDTISPDTLGNDSGKTFILKTNEEVEDMAKKFANDVR